jgi:hypothetical protein
MVLFFRPHQRSVVVGLFSPSLVVVMTLLCVATRAVLRSAFNFNLDIVAPECTIPDVSYKGKWKFTMLLPLCAGTLFLLMHLTVLIHKRFVLGRTKNLNTHVDVMIGSVLARGC